MNINNKRIAATPRSKYTNYSGVGGSYSGSSGGGSSVNLSNYVKLTGEESQTIEGHILATGDVVAYSSSDHDITLPIASSEALGTIKVGENLYIDSEGRLSSTALGGISSWNDLTDKPSWIGSAKPSYSYSEISNVPTSLPASDVYSWAKSSTKPSYSYSEISNTPTSLPANGGNSDTVGGYSAGRLWRSTIGTYSGTDSVLFGLNGSLIDNTNSGWSGSIYGFYAGGSQSSLLFKVIGGSNGMHRIQMNYTIDSNRLGDSWRTVATTDSNVASATQLQTSRTLWGQSFNGTGNVSGNMTGVGSITASGNITTSGNVRASGDVVAYSSGAGDVTLPIASASALGAVKYDDSTIKKNSSGQLYAVNSTSNVTKDSTQTISGQKSFTSHYVHLSPHYFHNRYDNGNDVYVHYYNSGTTGTLSRANIRVATGSGFKTLMISGSGSMVWDGTFSQSSDNRLKERSQNTENVLDKISNVNSFYYTRLDDEAKKRKVGISAQEIREIFPEVVEEDEKTEMLSVDYATLRTVIAISGCNELNEKIKLLEAKIERLEALISNNEPK